jgi:ABC-type enterobactin transport system permease subunit
MGLKTGSDEVVISNLGVYGLQSMLITVAAILGSITFAILFEKLLFREGIK